jgi:preprotein translocase subunit SecG
LVLHRLCAVPTQAFAEDFSPMETVLIVVHLLIVVALAVVVLLQRSEGGGLGIGGGGGSSGPSGFLTGRGQANVLTRSTAMLGAAFFVTSLALAIVASRTSAPRSIIDQVAPSGQTAPGAPAAPGGSVLDQLNQIQRNAPPAPPAAPAPPASN